MRPDDLNQNDRCARSTLSAQVHRWRQTHRAILPGGGIPKIVQGNQEKSHAGHLELDLAYRRRRRFRDLAKEVEKEAAKVIRKNAKELEGTAKLMNKTAKTRRAKGKKKITEANKLDPDGK